MTSLATEMASWYSAEDLKEGKSDMATTMILWERSRAHDRARERSN
jgi:hypothetical protein